MPPRGPKYVFSTDDLSVYERIEPDEFPDFDEVDSTTIEPAPWEPPPSGQPHGH